jgi:hypothetical protein
LVGVRNPVNKRVRKGSLNKVRGNTLRNVAKGVTFYIDLWGNVFDKYLGNMNWYPLACWAVLVPGYLEAGRVLHRGIHIQGSIARMSESLIKRRLRRR